METLWKLSSLAFVLVGVSSRMVDIGCDPGWLIYSGSCFMFNNQKLVTWSEARDECNRFDSSPVFFEVQADLDWYRNITSTQYPSSGYWTSMNDIVDNDPSAAGSGYWSWGMHEYVDTTLIQWSASPANDGRPACAGVNLQGKLYDADCNSMQGYVCMIDNGVSQGGCPMGWIMNDVNCFYVSNTSDASQLATWSQAITKCGNLYTGAHIFDLNDPSFLVNQLPYLAQTPYLLWIGLQSSGQAGSWKWFNNSPYTSTSFTWATEPDSVAGQENCGVIRYNGKFSDRGCNMKQNYICRKPEIAMDTTFNLGCGLWTRAGNKCYQFYTDPKSDWPTAKQTCTSFGGDLINIPNIDLKSWFTQQMQDMGNSGRFYWTALNDRDSEGVYKWGDGSLLDTNTITWNSEPNNWMGNEDCAVVYPSGIYNDVSCTWHAASLCELDNVQTCPTTGGQWASRQADTGSGLNCYLFGQYANESLEMTQQEASDYCKTFSYQSVNQGGGVISNIPQLYSVNSAAEATFINQQMQKYQDNANGYWTSLNDKQSEGFWQLGNDPSADTSFVKWAVEPSTATPDTDCVGVGFGGNFHVRKCSVKNPFICERLANFNGNTASGLRGTFMTVALVLLFHFLRLFH